jgi:Rps23 Pro-64 3,4-dihydroxylase Tpa1-like proline 4-hydroxylase
MNRNILEENIYYYENVIEDTKSLIKKIEDLDEHLTEKSGLSKWADWTAYQSDYAFGKQKMIREELFDLTNTIDIESEKVYKVLYDAIYSVSKDYESMHPGLDIGMLCPMSISKYFVGSMMGPHVDCHDDDKGKTISVVLYLNDDYTGGELNFQNQNIKIKPSAGSIAVFPSRSPYFHESLPVLSGEKYMTPGFWENRVHYQNLVANQ